MNFRSLVVPAISGGVVAASLVLAAPAHAATTVGVVMNGSELRMTGSDFDDDIELRADGGAVVVISRTATVFTGTGSGCTRISDFSVRCASVATVNAQLGLGNDRLLNNTNRPSVIGGGAGADTLTGGAGDDTISGGNGNDTLDGAGGRDTVAGGNNFDNCIGEIEAPTCES
ncbi:hypothetical protein ACWEQ0_19445 [Nocardia thailandica]